MGITIVGLGANDARLLTREAWDVLCTAEVVYLRTRWHPVVDELPAHVKLVSFDALYDEAADFTAVYERITAEICEYGRGGDVVYAVPGHPFVGEATGASICQMARELGIAVRVVEGLSFVEPMLTTVNLRSRYVVDGMDGLQVYDALELIAQDYPLVNGDAPVLIGQVYSGLVASDLKLKLNAIYPDEHGVVLVHGAGDTAVVEDICLYEIDRSGHIEHLTSLFVPALPHRGNFAALAEVVATLRSPHGCPWDQKQTAQSLRSGLVEEVCEVLEALDTADTDLLREELGDVLLHITMQAQIAAEVGDFTMTDVIGDIVAKLVRRHPHVWGDVTVEGSEGVVKNWEAIKAEEKKGKPVARSVLDGVPRTLPALAQSQKVQDKVRRVGFDWPTIEGVYDKLQEEIAELREADSRAARRAELGDILFVLVNLAKWLGVDAESAMREATQRFGRRFRYVERLAEARQIALAEAGEDVLLALWHEAKAEYASVEALERR